MGKRKQTIQVKVVERVIARECLGTLRDGSQCDRTASRRGLCSQCYNAMHNRMKRLPEGDRERYLDRLIADGRLLADGELSQILDRSVYARTAAEVTGVR